MPQSPPPEIKVSAAERKQLIVGGVAIAIAVALSGLLVVRLRRAKPTQR